MTVRMAGQWWLAMFAIFMLNMLVPLVYAAPPSWSRCDQNTTFNLGAGIADITGPAAEEGMLGYALMNQQTSGIAQRLWARAFIIESPCNQQRVVFVNVDLGLLFQAVKLEVVKRLQTDYGALYSADNVLISATHTHSGPGAFSTYKLYNLTTYGFDQKHFDAVVDGIVTAIAKAHQSLAPGQIKWASGELPQVGHNRSPTAYLLNPPAERARYSADIDTGMTLIRLDQLNGHPVGMINWFPLHGTSMNNKNHLISSDNKGYAEYLFEQDFKTGQGGTSFVAAFAQANAGDVSPNVLGHEGGHGLEGLRAILRAGMPQYVKAKTLYQQAFTRLQGGVENRHVYVDMSQVKVDAANVTGEPQMTCPSAIGLSMLAGTQDGEG